MNDRFKFRCFSRKTKKMYEVDSLHLDSKDGEWVWVHYYNPIYDKDLKIQIVQPNAVIMQCTGLKDKNGKLIYEGDILGGIYHGYIEYCKGCKCFQLFVKDYGCLACEGDLHWYELVEAEEQNELEVIGNIYENKELSEEE